MQKYPPAVLSFSSGQAGIEFLVMLSFSLLILSSAVFIYGSNIAEAQQQKSALEAAKICIQASSAINSLASLRGNSTYSFSLPEQVNSNNYTVWVSASSRTLKVDYGQAGVGCALQISNITNSSGASLFQLQKNASIRASGGVVTVG